jgi:hypothetical protein
MPKKSTEKSATPSEEPQAAALAELSQTTGGSSSGATDESNFLAAPVVTLPRLNPHALRARASFASSTSEAVVDTTPLRESYESVQEEASGPGVDKWRKLDKLRSDLTNLYNTLRDDERYAPQYKSGRAWEEYEKTRAEVERLAPEARNDMLRSAEGLERLSIPTPDGESLITKDTNKLLLTSNEYNRLQGLIDRAQKRVEKIPGFKAKPVDILKAEFERGLSEGGPGGGATVRAVVQLARDHELDVEAIVDEYRKPFHHDSLESAQRRRMWANMVGRSVPQPPFESGPSSSASDVGTYSSRGPKAFVPRDKKGMFFAPKGRRSHWK